MIIGFGHQARVGKDTAASILVKKYGFTRLSFADLLKDLAARSDPLIPGYSPVPVGLRDLVWDIGWEPAKSIPEVRTYLQNLGVAAREVLGEDVWVKPVLTRAAELSITGHVAITDVRFPNEFEAIDDAGGLLVKLTRRGGGAGNHVSETALERADWGLVIENNGTLEELESRLDPLVLSK